MARQSSGTYHLVFETNQEIWYARKTTSDTEWNNYQRLSSGLGGGNSSPCIAERGGKVYVVWQQGSASSYTVYFSKNLTGTWLTTPVSLNLSYDDGNQVRHAIRSGSSWSDKGIISNNANVATNQYSQVTADQSSEGKVHFAYQGYDHVYGFNVIMTRYRTVSFSWSPMTEFIYYYHCVHF